MIYYIIAYAVIGVLTLALGIKLDVLELENAESIHVGVASFAVITMWPMVLLVSFFSAMAYILGILVKKCAGRDTK